MNERYMIGGEYEPDYDGMWAEIESLDDAAREAVERANGGPVFMLIDPLQSHLDAQAADREALMRVIGMLSVGDGDAKAAEVAALITIRQAAGETPGACVKRITLALLNEMAGVE